MIQTLTKQKVAAVAPTTTRKSKPFQDSPTTILHPDPWRNGYRVAHLPQPGDPVRPATIHDVIIELGEYVGDGVPRDLSGCPFEPLDPHNYGGKVLL